MIDLDKEDQIIEELSKIRTLLEPKPAPPPPEGFTAEFKDFLSKYKVMGLAVAFILGLYLGALVKALVDDLVMPVVQFATPGVLWQNIEVGPFRVGDCLGPLLTFIIIALVVFLLVKLTKKLKID